ncbi:MAG: M15 family metallopeptidase [Lutibacter sp.]|uniref:M15 family metallopeptidase n=1 Tax=Lutibacter sp. TaxID=1925666 RepID=UPI00385A2701
MERKLTENIFLYILISFVLFYSEGFSQTLPKGFVYIKDIIPSIELELRYTSTNNFIGKPINGYLKPVGIVTLETALALKKVQLDLNKKNLGLKIYDAYRPQKAVNYFVNWAKKLNDTLKKSEYYPSIKKENLFKEQYIASKSGHSRGSTVDITLIYLSTDVKEELDMGSPFDFFGKESWISNQDLTVKQIQNRKVLQEVMKKYNFRNYSQEWWHFTLNNEPFPTTYFNFEIE